MRKFVLIVDYGTGRACMLTDTPDMEIALQQFKAKKLSEIPESKCYGLPPVRSAELLPLLYDSIYEGKEGSKDAEPAQIFKEGLFCKIGHEYSGVRHGVAA